MLLVVFGPPAVGKMTVGRAVAAASEFRLFHNHMTIEPLLETFGFGTPAFNTLNFRFRDDVLQQAAAHGVNLVFSVVWALDDEDDRRTLEHYMETFGGEVAFVELRADLPTRLVRHRTEERLAHKASKRDLDWSDANVREMEQQWQMTSEAGLGLARDLLTSHPHMVLDTTGLTPAESAAEILRWLGMQDVQPRWQARRDHNCPDDAARLLATVPEWFGIEEATNSYIEDARRLETWTVRDAASTVVGLALVERHFDHAWDLNLMVVDRAHHGQGIGSALVRGVEQEARRHGARLLQVKTLSSSHPDAGYARTRHFYQRCGFLPLEETDLWGPQNPCLVMVKPL